jgi:hypothetical protein
MSDARDKTGKARDGHATVPRCEDGTSPPAQDLDLEFHPIEIQGEPLSETIIRERR